MSIASLVSHAVGEATQPIFCRSLKTQTQVQNITYGAFSATPPTIIPAGMEAGLYYTPIDVAYQPISVKFHWFLTGGVLGQISIEIRSANNLTTYASAVLSSLAPVYPTPLTILTAFPIAPTPLKVVLVTDATCNSTVIPLAIEWS